MYFYKPAGEKRLRVVVLWGILFVIFGILP